MLTGKVVATLISVLVLAAVTLAWIAWRIVDNGYSWKRLFAFAASGRKQPGYSELTSDASSSMLRACMER